MLLLFFSVTTIATSYRKYIARKKYLIMRAAACVIAAHWKGLATRRYVKRYKAAVAVTRKFIIGFMNRNKPKCEQNIYVRKICIIIDLAENNAVYMCHA